MHKLVVHYLHEWHTVYVMFDLAIIDTLASGVVLSTCSEVIPVSKLACTRANEGFWLLWQGGEQVGSIRYRD